MKRAKLFGEEIKINEKDFKKILRRFDINNFDVVPNRFKFGFNTNKIKCPLCDKFPHNCNGCQFKKFANIQNGCIEIIKSIIKDLNYVDICDYGVSYYGGEEGRKKIKKIYNFLTTNFV